MNFYILAGGLSRRMGQNKALLKIDDQTLIEKVIAAIPSVKEKIKIVTNSANQYSFLGLSTIADVYPHLGPISGVHAGLVDSSYSFNFFLACDLPFVSQAVILMLLTRHRGQDILGIQTPRGREPLCTIYSKNCLPVIENHIKLQRFSLQDIFSNMPSEFIKIEDASVLFNVNTPNDWVRLLKLKKPA